LCYLYSTHTVIIYLNNNLCICIHRRAFFFIVIEFDDYNHYDVKKQLRERPKLVEMLLKKSLLRLCLQIFARQKNKKKRHSFINKRTYSRRTYLDLTTKRIDLSNYTLLNYAFSHNQTILVFLLAL
jgi:hypothetical protein